MGFVHRNEVGGGYPQVLEKFLGFGNLVLVFLGARF